jgi:hypothetical protein
MDEDNVVYLHNGVLFSHKEECNYVVCNKMEETGDHHVKQNKPDSERQISYVLSHMQNTDLKNDMNIKGGLLQ